jgi:hypothetical protein
MLLTGRVNFGLIQLCLRMVPSYLRDNALVVDALILYLYDTCKISIEFNPWTGVTWTLSVLPVVSVLVGNDCISMIQGMIESQETRLSRTYLNVAIAMLVHKLWAGVFKSGKHLNSFVPHCIFILLIVII